MTSEGFRLLESAVRAEIDRRYRALERVCGGSTWEARSLLDRAFSAAVLQEREHRGMAIQRGHRFRMPIEVAARFFVVEWYCDETARASSVLEAARLRSDCLCAAALRELVGLSEEVKPRLVVDYGRDIAGDS